jgi:hypothetical protein
MLKPIFTALCVVATASPLFAGEITTATIVGRWQGPSWVDESGEAPLTLDIVACGQGWCGVRVAANDTCGGTALKVNAGIVEENNAQFEGTLELAVGTEPYTIHATIFPPQPDGKLTMQVTGDTGGQFRAYRRSFPFEAQLARVQDPVCQPQQTVSSLDRQ